MATSLTEVRQSKAVPHAKWIEARKDLLAKEKEFTRQRDELSRLRRENHQPHQRMSRNRRATCRQVR